MERRKPFMQNVRKGGPTTIFHIKIMLCYILSSLKKPISAENLLNIVIKEQLVNYFEYESAMGELCDGGHVEKYTDETGEDFYKLSENGAALVVDLESSLSLTVRKRAVAAAIKTLSFEQNEKENNVTITSAEGGGYILSIEVPGEPQPLCKMQLYFPERLQAELAKDGFLTDPTLVYTSVLCALTGDKSTLLTALSDKLNDRI